MICSKLYRKIKSFGFYPAYSKGALNLSMFSAALRANIVFDFEESGIGSLYHRYLLRDHDHEKWQAYVVKKNLKIHYSARRVQAFNDRDGKYAACCQ